LRRRGRTIMRCADLRTIRMAFVDVPGFGAQDKSTWCDYVLKVYLDVAVTFSKLRVTRR
jgi:dephospho-CoA kinase